MRLVIPLAALLVAVGLFGFWLWRQPGAETDPGQSEQQTQQDVSGQDTDSNKKQVCPDKWYDNRMPGPAPEDETAEDRQYFIVDGERVDYEDMDVEWVRNNCSVNEPQPVY